MPLIFQLSLASYEARRPVVDSVNLIIRLLCKKNTNYQALHYVSFSVILFFLPLLLARQGGLDYKPASYGQRYLFSYLLRKCIFHVIHTAPTVPFSTVSGTRASEISVRFLSLHKGEGLQGGNELIFQPG